MPISREVHKNVQCGVNCPRSMFARDHSICPDKEGRECQTKKDEADPPPYFHESAMKGIEAAEKRELEERDFPTDDGTIEIDKLDDSEDK